MSSWDRFEVPFPFSKGLFVYGDPIHLPQKLERSEIETYRQLIEDTLNALAESGEKEFDTLYARGRTASQLQKETR